MSKSSIVVANALHAEDIRLASGGHIVVYWTVSAGIPRPRGAIVEPTQLQQLLENSWGKRDAYFLAIDFDYPADKAAYHAHKYVRNESVAVKSLGLVHVTRLIYPYLDPLRVLIPRPYVPFLGPPDLENEFYRGPAQNGSPFLREVYAEYRVYKIVGKKVDPWEPMGNAKLGREGYRGFNIILLNNKFFVIPQGEGGV